MSSVGRRILIIGAGVGSYPFVRALRPHAAFLAVAAWRDGMADCFRSRFVDRRLTMAAALPDDFAAAGADSALTGQARRFADEVVALALAQRATHVVAVADIPTHLVALAADRLREQGIVPCVPEAGAVADAVGKYAVLDRARRSGLAVPAAVPVAGRAQALDAAAAIGYPLIVKTEFSAGARGVRYVAAEAALTALVDRLLAAERASLLPARIRARRRRTLLHPADRPGRGGRRDLAAQGPVRQRQPVLLRRVDRPAGRRGPGPHLRGRPGAARHLRDPVQVQPDPQRSGLHRGQPAAGSEHEDPVRDVAPGRGGSGPGVPGLLRARRAGLVRAAVRPADRCPADRCAADRCAPPPFVLPAGLVGVSPVEDLGALVKVLHPRRPRAARTTRAPARPPPWPPTGPPT